MIKINWSFCIKHNYIIITQSWKLTGLILEYVQAIETYLYTFIINNPDKKNILAKILQNRGTNNDLSKKKYLKKSAVLP